MRRRLEEQLASHEASGSFLDRPAAPAEGTGENAHQPAGAGPPPAPLQPVTAPGVVHENPAPGLGSGAEKGAAVVEVLLAD